MALAPSHDNQLRFFLAVARAGSLREAADVLALSQPALSKQIRALELALEIPLFVRHGRGMTLTPDGQALFERIEPSFNAIDQAMTRADGTHAGLHASLRIATVHTLSIYFVPDLTHALLAMFPGLRLIIQGASSSDVVENVERGKADIGFVYESAVDSMEVETVPLHVERLALYVHEQSALQAGDTPDLSREPLILPPRQFALRRAVEREIGIALALRIECDSLELILRLVRQGQGSTILPEDLPADMVEQRGIRRISLSPRFAARRLVAIYRKNASRSPHFDQALILARGAAA